MNEKYQEYDDPREWLERARSNLILAKTNPENVFLEDLCFEAQQAAEKAIKALLIYSNCDYPYTHDMAELLTHLQEKTDLDIPEPVQQMPRLTRFAVASRYPGPTEPISDEEYQRALDIAEQVENGLGVLSMSNCSSAPSMGTVGTVLPFCSSTRNRNQSTRNYCFLSFRS